MHEFQSRARKDILNYLLLAAFVFIAYFPVSSFLFALKNDALTDNFPNKYFFSAALHDGYLPLWNPYINFGLPLYADPGFAFWQPITWIFGLIGYNLYTLSLELLFYIWLAGVFMFDLGRWLKHPRIICFCMAGMFMCCGFFVGNLQHINFLTSAAFLPLLTKNFLQLQEGFSYRRLFYCTIGGYLMLSGGHPAIPIATIYFLLFVLLGTLLFSNENTLTRKDRFPILPVLKRNLLLVLCLLALTAPLLYSYYEIMPFLNRSHPVIQSRTLNVGFTIPSYISFLFPFATTGNSRILSNDPLMRNGYFSFLGFALFVYSLLHRKNRYQRIFIVAGILMLILSLGGPIKETIFANMPLLKYIRTNGEFRVFALFSFIIAASFPLNEILKGKNILTFNRILVGIACICLLGTIWILANPSHTILLSATSKPSATGILEKIKWWLDHWTFYDRALINFVLMGILLLLYFVGRKKIRLEWLIPALLFLDLLSFCWMQLPITGVQKRTVASVENYFSKAIPGIPIPSLEPINNNRRVGENLDHIIGSWSYYSKQPGTPEYGDYPVTFTSTENYFHSGLPSKLNEKPFLFTSPFSGAQSALKILKYSPTAIQIKVDGSGGDSLVLLQNDYPYWEATINGEKYPIQKKYIAFMSLPLKEGSNLILFRFRNNKLLLWLSIMVITKLLMLMAVFKAERKQKKTNGATIIADA